MFKFVILLSAFAALAASASLQFTPSEMKKLFELVERSVKVLQEDAEKRVHDIEEGLHAVTAVDRERLTYLLEEANREFFEEAERVERENYNDQEVKRCLEEVTVQLEHVDQALIEENIEAVEREAMDILEHAAQIITESSEELDRLRREVNQCDTTSCADQLVGEIEQLQNRIGDEIEEVLDAAHAIVQVLEQEEREFDLREYSTDIIIGFVLEAQRCAA